MWSHFWEGDLDTALMQCSKLTLTQLAGCDFRRWKLTFQLKKMTSTAVELEVHSSACFVVFVTWKILLYELSAHFRRHAWCSMFVAFNRSLSEGHHATCMCQSKLIYSSMYHLSKLFTLRVSRTFDNLNIYKQADHTVLLWARIVDLRTALSPQNVWFVEGKLWCFFNLASCSQSKGTLTSSVWLQLNAVINPLY